MTIFKSKKGSTFVEAAVIMPLVILAVMSLFYILINLYENVELKSRLHINICAEAGLKSETFELSHTDGKGLELSSDRTTVTGSGSRERYGGGLLKRQTAVKETGHNHIIVEEKIIRRVDHVLPN